MEIYADIILPIPLPPLTFEVGEELRDIIALGSIVEVSVGAKKIYSGIVWQLHNQRPPFKTIKKVGRIIRPEKLLSEEQMALWGWVAEYYMCQLGDIMRVALPAMLKPSGLSGVEFDKKVFHFPMEKFVRLNSSINDEAKLNEAIEKIPKRAKAQYAAIMELCELFELRQENQSSHNNKKSYFLSEVLYSALKASRVTIKKMVEGGFFEIIEREKSVATERQFKLNLAQLSPTQDVALLQIKEEFKTHNTVLLKGITGSGKTEVYTHLIAEQLAEGHTVLYLLPEIAITKQLIDRLCIAFGNDITVYHSKLSPRNRTESYLRLCSSQGGELIIGVRSSIFLPLPNLGLIIVDEEHDRSFKQNDTAPRYSARDTAVWIAQNLDAKTLLGSATPSIESFFNAQQERYGYVTLDERYGEGCMPQMFISDTLRSVKRGERHTHFNKELLDAIEKCLENKRQVMLFQNRRGFAPYIECKECGWSARCPHCNVTLTLFKEKNMLRCNSCGYTERIPKLCPACKVAEPLPCGFGTEKVEEEIGKLFPLARVARLDSDTATSQKKYRQILDSFESGDTDILIGTQMITKGFDFAGVALVGVLNADNLLNFPDFRSSERAFQTLTQLAGRAGRNDAEGLVIIQTSQPTNPTLLQVVRGDYNSMVMSQVEERNIFKYPPFGRMISITFKHKNHQLLFRGANLLVARLRKELGMMAVTEAHLPVVEKVADMWIANVHIRIDRNVSPKSAKQLITRELSAFKKDALYKYISIILNVDPQ